MPAKPENHKPTLFAENTLHIVYIILVAKKKTKNPILLLHSYIITDLDCRHAVIWSNETTDSTRNFHEKTSLQFADKAGKATAWQ